MKNMKNLFVLILVLARALSLAACSGTEPDVNEAGPSSTVVVPGASGSGVVSEPAPATTPAPVPPAEAGMPDDAEKAGSEDLKAIAQDFVGAHVEDLYAAIGYPISVEDYVPSCLGPGEDGELHYDGFTVYTSRENGVETINVVR